MSGTLAEALGLRQTAVPPLVAFTGGGGKTSLIFALAAQLPARSSSLRRRDWPGHRWAKRRRLGAVICRYPDMTALDGMAQGVFLVIGLDLEDEKVGGVPVEAPQSWLARGDVTAVLVEADGARLLPFKAPAAYEPAVPPGTTLVVPVAGMDALDQPIRDAAHRPALVAGLLRKPQTAVLTVEDIAAVLAHPAGGLKGAPRAARVLPVLNKVENDAALVAARQVAGLILRHPRPQRVLLTAAAADEPLREARGRVTAVVLAAGVGQRMGELKQLLPWGDTTLLGQTLRTLGQTAVTETMVVCGAGGAVVAAEARTAGAHTVFNPDYARGEMLSSLQAAVRRLPASREAVLVVFADQPHVEPALIEQLLLAFWKGQGDLVAPVFAGQRGNPVLIGRRHFKELLALPVGAAPRHLLARHAVFLVPAPSTAVLQDIDERETYERLRPGGTPDA